MGGTGPAVLGLLCLLSGAVLPGFGQEVSTNQSADFGTDVPATFSPVVTSTVPHDSASAVLEFSDVTGGGKDNETIAATAPPPSAVPSTIGESESAIGTFAVTEGPQQSSSSSGGATASQEYSETRGVTGPSRTQPPPTANTPTPSVTEDVTSGAPSSLTESPRLPGTPSTQTQNNTETPPGSTQHAATATVLHADPTSAANPPVTTAVTTSQPTSPATQSAAAPRTSRPEEVRDPSLLEVGGHKDIPDFHTGSGSNPLFVMIVSVFTIMVVMVVVAVGFHRYKKRNRRTDFRRLQDLPMDDMMEDTPLALYSY